MDLIYTAPYLSLIYDNDSYKPVPDKYIQTENFISTPLLWNFQHIALIDQRGILIIIHMTIRDALKSLITPITTNVLLNYKEL